MIDFAAAAHGVLSQNFLEHLKHLAAADSPDLDQADHHPHILDHPRVPRGGASPRTRGSGPVAGRRGGAVLARSALVELALNCFAIGVTVIGGTTLCRCLLAMSFPATKGATQIMSAGIAWVGKEENPAVPAPGQADSQVRLGTQDRS